MATRLSPQDVLKALGAVRDPGQQRDIVSLGMVKDVEVGDNRVSLKLHAANPSSPLAARLAQEAKKAIHALGVVNVQVELGGAQASGASSQPNLIPEVKNTIAVGSGKGGVGKSTVAVNLAVALERSGVKVGLLDTDVYGPSVPHLMGSMVGPAVAEGKIAPPEAYGIKIMSMAYFLPKEEAVIWRGPMLHKAIHQFLGDVKWGELDYLVIDMPPGTGDVQLSLGQTIPLTGAVIVSTPQDIALEVASKAIAMFRKLNVPLLGVVENMSYYVCPHCGKREDIFGHGGARNAADAMHLPFLGEIPLDVNIRTSSDHGQPAALQNSTVYAAAFHEAARALVAQVERARKEAGGEIHIE
ncbi:MAG TPA: Mrp/NBP35 family ATP-binding protein [Terriglobia bacterium]|nr:Mrp/NBP35 family ATP-binding protein [Terriglobia bacterium]